MGSNMARASCESEMETFLSRRGRESCFCRSRQLAGIDADFVDVLPKTMRTLWRETFSCASLRAVRTAFSSAWKDEHHLPAGIVH